MVRFFAAAARSSKIDIGGRVGELLLLQVLVVAGAAN